MTKLDRAPLFVVSNHHTADCGQAPALNGDEPNTYHVYFENSFGEQSIFVYNRDTRQAVLWCGDAGWQQPFPVVNGMAEGLILSPEEQNWLQACWEAVRYKSFE